MEDHAPEFAAPFQALGIPSDKILYGAESVLLRPYRGIGLGHRFIDHREAHARQLGRTHVAFCSVIRPEDHPARPAAYRTNDAFAIMVGYWMKKTFQFGYSFDMTTTNLRNYNSGTHEVMLAITFGKSLPPVSTSGVSAAPSTVAP